MNLLFTTLLTVATEPVNEPPPGLPIPGRTSPMEGVPPWVIVLSLVLFAAGIVTIFILMRRQQRKSGPAQTAELNTTVAVFNRLCEANALTHRETNAIKRLIAEQKLDNPLIPFVDPSVYDAYIAAGPGRRAEVQGLKDKLFV